MRVASALAVALLAGAGACKDPPSPKSDAGARAAASASSFPKGRSWATPPPEAVDGGLVAKRLPRVGFRGGPFLRNPRVVTVTFASDDPALVARLEAFGDTITRTSWWREVVDSYCAKPDDCIGEGRPGPHVHLEDALPPEMRDVDVDAILERAAKAGRFGPLTPDTLLLVYLPKGVTLSSAYVPRFCDGAARAFHRGLDVGEQSVAYAVMPRCGSEAELTGTASHELVETSTNPNPVQRGFAFERDPDSLGFFASGIEPVDPCGLLTMDDHRTFESGFVVQRAWSNRAAALGRDPCVPSRPNRPYLALVPRQAAVRLAKEGETATVVVDAASDLPVPKWAASVFDLTGYQQHEQYVDVSIDKPVIGAGESATVKLTLKRQVPGELGTVAIVSALGVSAHMWPLAIVTR